MHIYIYTCYHENDVPSRLCTSVIYMPFIYMPFRNLLYTCPLGYIHAIMKTMCPLDVHLWVQVELMA